MKHSQNAESSLSCFSCGNWFYSETCSGDPGKILSAMNRLTGLLRLCKNYEEVGKQRFRDGNIGCEDLKSKMSEIERKFSENCDSLDQLPKNLEPEIDSRISSLNKFSNINLTRS